MKKRCVQRGDQEYLKPVYDLERLISRISYKTANPRDMIAFETSLEMLPAIKQFLKNAKTHYCC